MFWLFNSHNFKIGSTVVLFDYFQFLFVSTSTETNVSLYTVGRYHGMECLQPFHTLHRVWSTLDILEHFEMSSIEGKQDF